MIYKTTFQLLLLFLPFLSSSCSRSPSSDGLLRVRYYHPYGPEMKGSIWEERGKNGEVIQYYKSGISVRTNYVDGVRHGMASWSFPNSSTPNRYEEYDHGTLISFGVNYENGTAQFQEDLHRDGSKTKKEWYIDGIPKYIEEWSSDKKLIEGRYFSQEGEIEAEVLQGDGIRIERSRTGALQSRERYLQGSIVLRETFYLNGIVQHAVSMKNGVKEGYCHSYEESGEPISIEQWSDNKLNGVQTYFEHGLQISQVPFKDGVREGLEMQFRPGTNEVVAKISWQNGIKHGSSTFIFPDQEIIEWYWKGRPVTLQQFEFRQKQSDFAKMRQRENSSQ